MFPHREEAARAHENPGVPRRPARHRHHRRRCGAERIARRGEGHGKSEARLLGCGCRCACLSRSAREPRVEPGQHLGVGYRRRRVPRPKGGNGPEQGPVCAQDTGAYARRDHAARRPVSRPFDPRLIVKIARAVAKAARDSGVATRPIADFDAYNNQLLQFVYHSGLIMKPIFNAAKEGPRRRIVFAEGEDERTLRAAQVVVDEGLASLILVGRPSVVERRIERHGLRIRPGTDFELVNPESDPRYRDYWTEYHRLTERRGVSQQFAQMEMRRRHALIGSMMIHRGDAEGIICGTFGTYGLHLRYIDQVIGLRPGARHFYAMKALM